MTVPAKPARAIRRRLLASGTLLVLVVVLGCGVAMAVATTTTITLNHRIDQLLIVEQAARRMEVAISDQEMYAFDYSVAHQQAALHGLRDAQDAELTAYEDLERAAADDGALISGAGRVRELASRWRSGWIQPFVDRVAAGGTVSLDDATRARGTYDLPLEAAVKDLTAEVSRHEAAALAESAQAPGFVGAVLAPLGLMSAVVIALAWVWLTRTVSEPLHRLNARARQVIAGEDLPFVPERDDEIGALADVLERLRQDAMGRYRSARLEADRAAVFNQLAELISFAQDEEALVVAASKTLRRIADAERGDLMLVNNSTNRLIVAATWGGDPSAVGQPANIDRIDRCPGIRRATAYVAHDLADDMAVRCPAHPAEAGAVACVPMPALGTIVGVIHLERPEAGAFDPETIAVVARIAEQVALAIANARLMRTMEGLAMTDPLTGLKNPRFFDGYLEQELAEASRDGAPTALLMLDVDHFKRFNDTNGHPAGDEALRTFARVLRGTVRSSDVIARYGGEEFVIALHRTRLDDARAVAEKVRAAVEAAVVEIGPGRYGRMTVSIGVAACESGRADPKGLVALADAALYRAKESGRNRVEMAPTSEVEIEAAARRRAGRDAGPTPEEAAVQAVTAPAIAHIRRARRAQAAQRKVG
jgi:diguanylate cyclase (GGDEF)-like protein